MSAVAETTPSHLRGNGRPVTEELTLADLKVNGKIPEELNGRYVRTGPNPITGTSTHPFLGDACDCETEKPSGTGTDMCKRHLSLTLRLMCLTFP